MSLGTIVLGLINGSVIGLLALGFVLVYKANKFLNLAHAQIGSVTAIFLAKLVNDWGWNFWLALLVCLPLGALVGLCVERFLVRPVRQRTSSPVRLLILTVGISQLLLALTYVPFLAPDAEKNATYPQPFTSDVTVGGVVLSGMSVLTLVAVPLILVALSVVLNVSSVGKRIRAAASNPEAARLCGISINRVSLVTWALAGGLSSISAVLNGPSRSTFNIASVGPELLMFTMGAAAFGAFVSLPWAVGGGVALGVVYQVVAGATHNAGNATLAVFAVILVVIFVRGAAISRVFAASGAPVPERATIRIPDILKDDPVIRFGKWWLYAATILSALMLPLIPYFSSEGNRFLLALVLIYALVAVSLTILIGWSGQVSLGHFALVGLGAYFTARWVGQGWTILACLLTAGLIGAAVTVIVGLPALRVRGLTLVVTTLGLAVIAPQYLYLQHWVGGDTPFTTPVSRVAIGLGLGDVSSQLDVYYLALLTLSVAVVTGAALRRSNAGRLILAVRDNERAAAAFGVTPATVKLTVLALSGFIAGAAGVFWAIAWQRVTPTQLGPEVSTALLALPVIGGLGSLAGALAGTAVLWFPTLFLAPYLGGLLGSFGQSIGFLLLLGGLGAVAGMHQFPNGIAGLAAEVWQRYLDRRAISVARNGMHGDSRMPLVVTDARIHFGGVLALDRAAIEVHPGEIVGLIGPNGAGKTTLMNVISGVLAPDAGSVSLFGREVVDLPPDVRARYGLARSFQDASLFAGLTVLETVQLAVAQECKTGVIGALINAPWVRAHERASRTRAAQVLEDFGLTNYADSLTSSLSTGTRRICDLAAQVASNPKLLVLDEPTAGVAQRDAEAFGPLVRRIRDQLGCSILVIEHDMPLLMGLCDRIYAMEAGRVIAEGTPSEIRENADVVAGYLGTQEAAITRSGRGNAASKRPKRAPRKPTSVNTGKVHAS